MVNKRGIVIHPEELCDAWLDDMEALRLNVLGLHPEGGPHAPDSLRRMLDSLPAMEPLLRRARGMGMSVEYELHAVSYLLPRRLFAARPTWFREDESGNRTADLNCCASSEEALNQLSREAETLARLLPADDHRYHFWTDDACNGSCHCARCRALTPSDQQMILINAMLRGARRVDPLAQMAYLAYLDALEPPRRVRPDENVFLEYAPFRRDPHRPIGDGSCPVNAAESAPLGALLNCFGVSTAMVLDYWTDNSLFSQWTRPPRPFELDAEVMRADVAYYRSLGIDFITAFGCYLSQDYAERYGRPRLLPYGEILINA